METPGAQWEEGARVKSRQGPGGCCGVSLSLGDTVGTDKPLIFTASSKEYKFVSTGWATIVHLLAMSSKTLGLQSLLSRGRAMTLKCPCNQTPCLRC